MIPFIPKQSALDLTTKGSIGHFVVSEGGESSVRVEYLLTHVGLALEGDHEEGLLHELKPVREVFDLKRLSFEEIMQRDIDDARVSTKLIPYLFDESASGLIKLFPPIVVVVIPTDNNGLPADTYPPVEELTQKDSGYDWRIVRSGEIGKEAFEVKQLLVEGKPQEHDYAQLRINTKKCRLVIVDGQHRAMALIALYRNKKGWPDKTRGVEPYYKRWSPSVIAKYGLGGVRLPIMLCVLPDLDGKKFKNVTVSRACRSIFLALNRNAKKVSRARNYLLDDSDMISSFMRSVLAKVKDTDATSSRALRIWNIELDADEDRTALRSATAVTGVMHLYSMIERMMLADPPAAGLGVKKQNLWLKKNIDLCIERLGAKGKLTKQAQESARKLNCEKHTEAVLMDAFGERYGELIVRALDEFAPYHANNRAALDLKRRLETSATGDAYLAILFDGQSMDRVFESYLEGLSEELDDMHDSGKSVPELESLHQEFAEREKELDTKKKELGGARIERWFERLDRKGQDLLKVPSVLLALDRLYTNTFVTSAFQSALMITFFAVIEATDRERGKPPVNAPALKQEDVHALFAEYMQQVNAFCAPDSEAGLVKLLSAMVGPVKQEKGVVEVASSSSSLRAILIPGELKPDEWPKFRAILLELWKCSDESVARHAEEARAACRRDLAKNYLNRQLTDWARDHGVSVPKIPPAERDNLRKACAKAVVTALSAVGATISEAEMLSWIPSQDAAVPEPVEDAG